MEKVNVAYAKEHFSDILGRVAYGKEEIYIFRRNRAMAKLVPVDKEKKIHLADVKGWLFNDDPFFEDIEKIIKARSKHIPRIM